MRGIFTFLIIIYIIYQGYQYTYIIKKQIDRYFNLRIINGESVLPGELPYQVSISYGGSFLPFCSGSIINEYYIVTSASCLERFRPHNLVIKAGSDIVKPNQTRVCREFIKHENYSKKTFENDIALLMTYVPLEFNDYVQPVKLPKLNETFPMNTHATVSGWGQLGYGGTGISIKLRVATIFISDVNECRKKVKDYIEIQPTHICANEPHMKRAQCYGDIGGPLTVNEKLIGIMSWQYADPWCTNTFFPNVYTRVSEYVEWINKKTV